MKWMSVMRMILRIMLWEMRMIKVMIAMVTVTMMEACDDNGGFGDRRRKVKNNEDHYAKGE